MDTTQKHSSSCCKVVIPTRYIIVFMAFLGTTNIYTMRTNMSVAIIAMAKPRPVVDTGINGSTECPASSSHTAHKNHTTEGEFDWDEHQKGIVLSSFFWGYICTCFLGGLLSERYSAKWVTGIGILSTAIFTLLTPVAARLGIWYLVAIRFLEGMMEGATYSGFYSIVGRWCPPNERGITVSILHLGDALGTIVASPISGLLVAKSLDGGWPLVFYCFGSIGIVWVIFWAILVYDSPELHPRIASVEKDYILKSLSVTSLARESVENIEEEEIKKKRFPWLAALTSPAVWALVAGHIAHTWGYYTLLTELPNYMKTVLHFDTHESAMLSALPYIAKMVLSIISGLLVDYVIKKNFLTVIKWRKIFNTFANVVPACLFIAVPYIGCNKYGALAALTVSAGFHGVTTAGTLVNNVDIAPNHAGSVFGLMNTPGSVPKILAPYLVGYLTNESSTIETWSTVFFIAAGVHLVGNLIFVLFGKGKPQSWN